ncbi:conjugal transfer protein TrbF [Sphingobium yanoikuyae]|jgi:type IV secretion system protein VirB5|uniref:conjugal transfer protein TrbF n=1 Tax=Sphingobium yanoikuyae TaxID=13690 RepID=UPI0013775464|nr:conjugal transfer protein TrbF [Sphingobium yanoikuyae]NBB40707.1 conjugal transfer protein TrbF [Sphingobium yanoikuyae]
MFFKRAAQRYAQTPHPVTPYQHAAQVWDDRIGNARAQAHHWRLMALGSLGLSALMAAGLVWQSLQSRVTPYVVEVDRLGEARAVSPADAAYDPTDPQISWQLTRFIENVRAVSLDPVLMRRAWLQAYDFTSDRGALYLNDYARARQPFARIGDRTISVQVTSVLRASDRSFQIKWSETEYERGARTGTSRWTALLTISRQRPISADRLRRNPLGIYIDAIDWSRELDDGEPVSPPVDQTDAPSENTPSTDIGNMEARA